MCIQRRLEESSGTAMALLESPEILAWRRPVPSRRGFFRLAGAGAVSGVVAVLAACGAEETAAPADLGPIAIEGDIALLNAALELEHTQIAAHRAGARLLEPALRTTAGRLLANDRAHAGALSRAVDALGATPAAPRGPAAYGEGFPPLTTQHEFLAFGIDLATTAVAAYIDMLPKLVATELRPTVAAIAAGEGGHAAVLLGALGRPQAPDAFFTGRG